MFTKKLHGKRDIGDVNTTENKIMNLVFFVGVVITLLVAMFGLYLYAF
jgi:hypothetical protein